MNKDSEEALSQGFLPVLPYNTEINTMQLISSISTWFASWHTTDRGKSPLLLDHPLTPTEVVTAVP